MFSKARLRDCEVLTGAAYDEQPVPYGPLSAALEQLDREGSVPGIGRTRGLGRQHLEPGDCESMAGLRIEREQGWFDQAKQHAQRLWQVLFHCREPPKGQHFQI